jgi:cytochrome d ubiquinol oxidase subunit II
MHLSDVWFIAIAVLWAGYFVLEGFDFGVAILLPVLGRGQDGRRVMINTIGPVWDGNEVWLLTAGGATFAAFPFWYASMFSAFYLPLLIVLVFLILRGVAFEFRGKRESARWRRNWDISLFAGSLVPAILWGVAFGNVVRGIPLNAAGNYTGNFFTLLNGYALLGGLATLTLFTLHGAVFLTLRTSGWLRERAAALAPKLGVAAVLAGGAFLAWTEASYRAPGHTGTTGAASVGLAALAALALIAGVLASWAGREGVAFTGTAVAIAAATGALFTAVYPRVLPSTVSAAYSLTTGNAASAAKTLAVMTVVAAIFLPFVLAYQAWTFWVFRKRLASPAVPSAPAVAGPGTASGQGAAASPGPAGQ